MFLINKYLFFKNLFLLNNKNVSKKKNIFENKLGIFKVLYNENKKKLKKKMKFFFLKKKEKKNDLLLKENNFCIDFLSYHELVKKFFCIFKILNFKSISETHNLKINQSILWKNEFIKKKQKRTFRMKYIKQNIVANRNIDRKDVLKKNLFFLEKKDFLKLSQKKINSFFIKRFFFKKFSFFKKNIQKINNFFLQWKQFVLEKCRYNPFNVFLINQLQIKPQKYKGIFFEYGINLIKKYVLSCFLSFFERFNGEKNKKFYKLSNFFFNNFLSYNEKWKKFFLNRIFFFDDKKLEWKIFFNFRNQLHVKLKIINNAISIFFFSQDKKMSTLLKKNILGLRDVFINYGLKINKVCVNNDRFFSRESFFKDKKSNLILSYSKKKKKKNIHSFIKSSFYKGSIKGNDFIDFYV